MSCPRLHSWKVTEPGFGGGPSTCGASQVVLVGKESTCNAGDAGSIPRSIPPGGRAWQPTPVFLPRESHGQRSLVGCHKDLNMTEATERACIQVCRPAVWTEPSGAKLFLVSLQTRCPHLLRVCVCVCVCEPVKSLQSCPTLCDPMDCSLPVSYVHGVLQARILE